MTRCLRWLLLCGLYLAVPVYAHQPSDSYLTIERRAQVLSLEWAIALRDLEVAVGLDADGDAAITWGELQVAQQRLSDYALAHLDLYYDDTPQALTATALLADDKNDGAYAVLRFTAPRPDAEARVALDYRLLFDIDPTHRGLLAYDDGGRSVTRVAAPDTGRLVVSSRDVAPGAVLADYFIEGVWHIWIGFDHVLFLITLLLPALLVRRDGSWQPVAQVRPALIDLLKVITAFTLAHSVTLALATLQLVSLPSRLVEAVIALSVLVAALNNLWPVITRARWRLAFVFGLIHGFGFASVLGGIGLPAGALALALGGFNLGVEAGQLAIVALVFPLLVAARHAQAFRPVVLGGGSAAAALLASGWLLERVLS